MKFIVANWKAYVTDIKAVKVLADAAAKARPKGANIVLCPPFTFLPLLKASNAFSLGAQDVFWEDEGAYTGEITPKMLMNADVEYAIIGHSERRRYMNETDEMVNMKVKAALRAGLLPIVCVGEKEREDKGSIPLIVAEQTRKAFADIQKSKVADITVAYEPIWAIGTGISDTPNDALSAALYIRKAIADMYDSKTAMQVKVLYGGSVNAQNVAEFVDQDGIDGMLIGRASTDASEFIDILKSI